MLKKDTEEELPIPEEWRARFRQVVDAFAAGDFQLRERPVDGVAPIERATADYISANIAAYGAPLAPLDDAAWERSVYSWMEGYWEMIVDLTTEDEPVSDLIIHAKLGEAEGSLLEISSVYVP